MTLDLRGAVVAVTGASAGIGRECVLAFAREGSRLAAAARRLDRLEALAAEVRALGAEILVQKADVGEAEDVKRFVQATVERFGRLDVLVNNAGYGVRGTVEATPAAAYERLMRVNYLGTVYGCQAALPIMRGQGAGVIVNVSSIVGHRALPAGGAYAATKAAQISLTEALRAELRGSGVHACTVHPIGTETEFREVAAGNRGRTTRRAESVRSSPRARWRRRSCGARSAQDPRCIRTRHHARSCGWPRSRRDCRTGWPGERRDARDVYERSWLLVLFVLTSHATPAACPNSAISANGPQCAPATS